MGFLKSFDELFDSMLTDYINQFPDADVSQGSLIYIKSACLSSALWGIYKYQHYIAQQPFPDTADSETLDHHAFIYGLSRNVEETDASLLSRILDRKRRPPAGGNKYDYIKWALENSYVSGAHCFPVAQGLGTVDVVLVASKTATGDEIPSIHAKKGSNTSVSANKLVDSAADFLDTEDPVRLGDIARNFTDGTEAIVTAIDDENQLSLSADIFTGTGKTYAVQSQPMTGTVSDVSEGKLVDSTADFNDTDGPVRIGDIAVNRNTGIEATVTDIDSDTQLSLSADIFKSAGHGYKIKSLLKQVKDHIDDVRPVTAHYISIVEPKILSQDVNIAVSGENVDLTKINGDIEAALNTMAPTRTLYVTKLVALAIGGGAENVIVDTPAADVVPSGYEMIRKGTITVSKV